MPVLVVGTRDTKAAELDYVGGLIAAAGCEVVQVDVGTRSDGAGADVTPAEVAGWHPTDASAVRSDNRGQAVEAMSAALVGYISSLDTDSVSGIIGLGGSGGTALITPAMRALPVGVPKLMVSTVASGNVAPYVGPTDITMMYSVTDVAGINRISRVVLANAAHAIAGMAGHEPPSPADEKPAVGLTMFGVTTPLVTALVSALEADYDPLVFHATGTGGQSMEKLVDSGMVVGVLDMTTTEVADHIVGGVFSAGPGRLDAIIRSGVPYVGSVGALDMVNFGALDTVPAEFADRQLFVHNSDVTLMRTTPAENALFGEFIAGKLNAMPGPAHFLLPEGGVSAIDGPGQPFDDPEALQTLLATIESGVSAPNVTMERLPHNINDAEFAEAALAAFRGVVEASQ